MPAAQDDLDPLIGRIALQRGLLDQRQLLEALRECTGESRLSDVLLQHGYVKADAITAITRDLGPLLARSGDWEHVREEDIKLAKTLITRKVLTEEDAKTALKTQTLEARQDPAMIPRLAVILIRDSILDFETLKPFLHVGLTVEFLCPQCGVGYMIPESGAGRKWLCRKCKGLLARKQGASVHVKDDSIPEDVRGAMADEKRKFGKFWLLSELGRGGMGVVYKAWEPALKRYIAIKVLLGKSGAEDVARFYREAQVAAKLRHPNIIQIYEVSKAAERHYISMEYVDGRTLGGEKLPARRAAELLVQAAIAVDSAHREGVVHRDIKPSNLMLDGQGKVFVMDFGLAKSLAAESRLTAAGTIVGTPSYMSPEQAQGKLVDKISDTYSLGAVLYELLTSRPPFRANNPIETLNQVLNKEPEPPSKLAPGTPRELEAITLKALEKDRKRRYPSAKALADDLQRWLTGAAVSAKSRGAADKLARALTKKLPIAIALGVAVIVAGLIFFVVSRSRARDSAAVAMQEGDEAIATGDLQKAIVAYSRAAATFADLPGLTAKLDDARKRADDAKRAADEAVQKAQRDEEARKAARAETATIDAAVNEASLDLYRTGNDLSQMAAAVRQAVQRYTKILDRVPGFAECWLSRGRAHALLFEVAEAERDFTKAIALNDRLGAAYRERGELLLRRYLSETSSGIQEATYHDEVLKPLGKRASDDFHKAAALEGSADRDYLEAAIAFAEQRPQDVDRVLTRAIDASRGKEQHFHLRGQARYTIAQKLALNDPNRTTAAEGALKDFDEALRRRPNFYDALYLRAAVKFDFVDRASAIADFEAATRINPREANLWHGLGLAYEKLGELDRAITIYEKGLAADPRAFRLLTARGHIRHMRREYQSALADYDLAIQVNPRFFIARLNKAGIYSNLKDDARAITEFDLLVKDFPNNPDVYNGRGRVHYRLDHMPQCIDDLEHALLLGFRDVAEPTCKQIIENARKRSK